MARAVVLVLALAAMAVQPPRSGGVEEVRRGFANPPDDSRAMMRWWWFGPSVTRDELDTELRQMREGGFGGFELAVVYPLAIDDPAHGIRNDPYLSPAFLDALRFTAGRARQLGLRMDLTLGSGWPFGGAHITPALASMRLRSERREIAAGVRSVARPQLFDSDRLIAAFVGRGSIQEADPAAFQELPIVGNGPLRLPDQPGPRVVLFYFSSQTGQVVKRAAIGADGYVLDHYNRAAIDAHLREVGERLLAAVPPGSINSIFCDSLEVYDADWTGDLLDEFRRRRGYDLRPLLPLAELAGGDRGDAVRRDYGRTLTELFEERFLAPVHDWAVTKGVRFRIQNYGIPPATIASARLADVVDGEGFEWRTLSSARWASSAAHLFGKPTTSSETWTWLHSPAFRATPLDLKAEADQHFLSGINQLIGHGWPYSPPAAGSPGWMFYAAGAFNAKNPWWPVMPDLARYLQRVSYLLRQGEPIADLAVYAPAEEAWAQMRPATGRGLNLWLAARDVVGARVVSAILDAGHSFDVIDERTLGEALERRYRAIVLPRLSRAPEPIRQWLADYTARGGKIVTDTGDAALSARIAAALPADVMLDPPTPEIGFVHRRLRDAELYFLANTSNTPRTVTARFSAPPMSIERWDPMTGDAERLPLMNGAVLLTFEPYASHAIVVRGTASDAADPASPRPALAIPLDSGWTVAVGEAPAESTALPHSWIAAEQTRLYSGVATYRRRFSVNGTQAGRRVTIDFGSGQPVTREALPGGTMRGNSFAALIAPPVREAATVFVNGRRAGSIWAPPYRLEIGGLVQEGANELQVDVYNTAINQLAAGGHLPDTTAVTERYGQRFRLQDLDNLQPIPSGLLTVPRLLVER